MQTTNKVNGVRELLRFTYGFVPIIAGLDKFSNFLTQWTDYLSPMVLQLIPVTAQTFMNVVGVIEIIAGFAVLVAPRFGGYLVMTWLLGIVVNLISTGKYFDIAVRDTVMAIGAYSLARLSEAITVEDNYQNFRSSSINEKYQESPSGKEETYIRKPQYSDTI